MGASIPNLKFHPSAKSVYAPYGAKWGRNFLGIFLDIFQDIFDPFLFRDLSQTDPTNSVLEKIPNAFQETFRLVSAGAYD